MSAPRRLEIDPSRIHPNMTEDEIQSLALGMMAQMTSAEVRRWHIELPVIIRMKAARSRPEPQQDG